MTHEPGGTADQEPAYGIEPSPQTPRPSTAAAVDQVNCKQCGYDLSGLPSDGRCPECGLPVERSLTDDLLKHSAPAYLASLHRGVVLILASVILKLMLVIGGFAGGVIAVINGIDPTPLFIAIYGLDIVASVGVAVGWWLFSAPDPAFTGRFDGSTARKVVRVTTVIVAAIALVLSPVQIAAVSPTAGVAVLAGSLEIISFIAWATGFFAAMLYLRWLAPRIPDWRVHERAKTLMWLGPVLYTVGALCVGLGPLIALVLYWNMLDWTRRDLRDIRAV